VHRGYGLGEINAEGKSILDFSLTFDLNIANTCFRKRDEHLITYKSGASFSQIDFFLIRKSDRNICLDCKVIPGESLTTEHRIMVMDVRVKRRARRRSHSGPPGIKWWHLKGVKQRIFQHKMLEGGFRQPHGSVNDMWERMTHEIKKVAKETWEYLKVLDLGVKILGG